MDPNNTKSNTTENTNSSAQADSPTPPAPSTVIAPQPLELAQPASTPVEPAAPVASAPHDISAPVQQPPSSVEGSQPVDSAPGTQGIQANLASQQPVASQPSKPKKSKKKLKLFGIILGVLLIIGAASAAAYIGYYLPNTPENRLLKSFANFSRQKHASARGELKIDVTDQAKNPINVAVDYEIQINSEQEQASINGNVNYQEVDIPFEARLVDDSLFMRAEVKAAAEKFFGLTASDQSVVNLYTELINKVNNKWYFIEAEDDESKRSECLAGLDLEPTDEDLDVVYNAYKKNPMFVIKTDGSVDIDGQKTDKFILSPSEDQIIVNLLNDLNDMDIANKIRECAKEQKKEAKIEEVSEFTEVLDRLNIYITPDNQIRRVELLASDEDGSIDLGTTFDYNPVTIEKPQDATPFKELFNDLFPSSSAGGFTQGLATEIINGRNMPVKLP